MNMLTKNIKNTYMVNMSSPKKKQNAIQINKSYKIVYLHFIIRSNPWGNSVFMRFDIVTVVPDLLDSPLNHSIIKKAKEKKAVEIVVHNIRDYATNKHKSVDDYPYGGDAGMVLQIEPIHKLIETLTAERKYDAII